VKGIAKIEWRAGGPSRYHLVAEQLRKLIKQNIFVPGERLPSEKEMVEVYDWSRGTVRAACDLLQTEGLTGLGGWVYTGVRGALPCWRHNATVALPGPSGGPCGHCTPPPLRPNEQVPTPGLRRRRRWGRRGLVAR
jgi:DNA-binding transcriptional MocR family regulator